MFNRKRHEPEPKPDEVPLTINPTEMDTAENREFLKWLDQHVDYLAQYLKDLNNALEQAEGPKPSNTLPFVVANALLRAGYFEHNTGFTVDGSHTPHADGGSSGKVQLRLNDPTPPGDSLGREL